MVCRRQRQKQKQRRSRGRTLTEDEKASVGSFFLLNYDWTKPSHSAYHEALQAEMARLGHDIADVNPERLSEYMRSRIRGHRNPRGEPCYREYRGCPRKRQSPYKGMSREQISYFREIGRRVTLPDPPC